MIERYVMAIDPWKKTKGVFSFNCIACGNKFDVKSTEMSRKDRPIKRYCNHVCYMTHYQAIHGGRNKKTGTMTHKGYILSWDPKHPSAVKGYVPQHRLMIENHIGRLLNSDEVVHHLNHIRNDNRIENLEIMSASDHHKLHAKDLMKLISVDGLEKCVTEWCKIINIAPASFRDMAKRRSLSYSETVSFYLKKKGISL